MKALAKIYLIIIVFSLFTENSSAQSTINYNMYSLHQFSINPSSASITDGITGILNIKRQFVGLDGAPTRNQFSICGRFMENVGLGAQVVMQKENLFESLHGVFVYSYRVDFLSDHHLHMGLSGGVVENRLNRNNVETEDFSNDNTLYPDYYNDIKFITGLGLTYIWNGLTIGLSAPSFTEGNTFKRQVMTYVSYKYLCIDKTLEVKPSVLYQAFSTIPNQMDINLFSQYKEMIWTQFTYRSNKSYIISLGSQINNANIGYAYEIFTDNLSYISNGSHEIVLLLNLQTK